MTTLYIQEIMTTLACTRCEQNKLFAGSLLVMSAVSSCFHGKFSGHVGLLVVLLLPLLLCRHLLPLLLLLLGYLLLLDEQLLLGWLL